MIMPPPSFIAGSVPIQDEAARKHQDVYVYLATYNFIPRQYCIINFVRLILALRTYVQLWQPAA